MLFVHQGSFDQQSAILRLDHQCQYQIYIYGPCYLYAGLTPQCTDPLTREGAHDQ